jgi:hypothetical protein
MFYASPIHAERKKFPGYFSYPVYYKISYPLLVTSWFFEMACLLTTQKPIPRQLQKEQSISRDMVCLIRQYPFYLLTQGPPGSRVLTFLSMPLSAANPRLKLKVSCQ